MVTAQLTASASHRGSASTPPRYQAGAVHRLEALRRLGRKLDAQDPDLIREAAALLTSQLFFAPLLAEARKLPFGGEFAQGGRMEEAFGEQLDLQLADAVARSDRGLTRQLAERLARGPRAKAVAGPTAPRASWLTHLQAREAGGESKGFAARSEIRKTAVEPSQCKS